jgi:prephenate dehydrogenase
LFSSALLCVLCVEELPGISLLFAFFTFKPETQSVAFRQITIIGVGLIGGSFGLAARAAGFSGPIVGCGRPETMERARRMGAIDCGYSDPVQAASGSDLILLATPVGAIIDLLQHAASFPQDALITDAGSTKTAIVERARLTFGNEVTARFLPGHPMAGKELSGIEQAEADLFRNAVWLITPLGREPQVVRRQSIIPPGSSSHLCALLPRLHEEFLALLNAIGARVLEVDLEKHDRLCAWISHLPQMIATALAGTLEDEFGNDGELHAIGGRALREMTRIASSPYSMWRDIAITNTGHIQEALLRVEERLAYIRENLRSRELGVEFERAQRFRKQTPG